ncbi:MAG TPA: M48 family metallopeptidase [Noviherbaspirillum sp.]|nr:M48 family metallopeptidase [Noviherbaspirillum sp.]
MNFFQHQEHARRQSRTLVILFALAVVAIVVAVNLATALVWSWTKTGYVLGMHDYPRGFFATNTLISLALIAGGTLIEMFNLRDGGDAVARMAGGRPVSSSTTDLQERRLLNVVEEMALASGIACPRVYLLDKEEAINAFAAGYNQDEAVVAVTKGALTRLNRDELQGVVAHEFSHILNGDMRLNIRLIGLLFGIQMIAGFGQHLIDFGSHSWSARERSEKGPSLRLMLFLTGLALLVIGYIGVFFGRLIKAAVSRQREFLADASAVQFTRNADGIGGALRKIGGLTRSNGLGTRIEHPNAEQLSHLFLGAPKPSLVRGLLATHPTIEERLFRIYGRQVEPLEAQAEQGGYAGDSPDLPDIPYVDSGFAAGNAPGHWITQVDEPKQDVLPPDLDHALRDMQGAAAVVHALLVDCTQGRDAQIAALKHAGAGNPDYILFLAAAISKLPRSARLPLLDLATPALKQLPQQERNALLQTVDRLVAADSKLTLAEFVLQTVLARRLDAHAARPTPVRFAGLSMLKRECVLLLSLVAHVSASAVQADAASLFAQGAARCTGTGISSRDMLPVSSINYDSVREALDRARQMAPLAKPMLVKALLAAAGDVEPMPAASADLLRAVCAGLEVPVPAAVAATYTAYHWSDPSEQLYA